MAKQAVDSAVGPDSIPESVLTLSSLPDFDYVDHFTLDTELAATPEQWARAMFGDVPTISERLIWRGLLGLRLSPGVSRETVAGWRIEQRGEGWIRLATDSWFLTGNLVVGAVGATVSLTTFLRYDRRLGHWVWPPLSATHRRLCPGVLRDAAAKLEAG